MNQLPTNEIPWTQIGAFGSFAIIVLALVLWFILRWRKGKNTSGGTINRTRCVNDSRAQLAFTDLALTKESMTEMKQDIKGLTEKTVQQTGILTGVLRETERQTRALEKVCSKIGRQ